MRLDAKYVLTERDKFTIASPPKRPEDLHVVQRLEQIRLPGTVGSDDDCAAIGQHQVECGEVPKPAKRHGPKRRAPDLLMRRFEGFRCALHLGV